jgi:hypothetical protein
MNPENRHHIHNNTQFVSQANQIQFKYLYSVCLNYILLPYNPIYTYVS